MARIRWLEGTRVVVGGDEEGRKGKHGRGMVECVCCVQGDG